MKLESWAEPVLEEMEKNGYLLLVEVYPQSSQIRVMFCKENVVGATRGEAEDYSHLVVRAAIMAFQETGCPQGLVKR